MLKSSKHFQHKTVSAVKDKSMSKMFGSNANVRLKLSNAISTSFNYDISSNVS